ncbi:LAS superfamily LD-carboxypeptidase LdcB [Cellulomonas uda]|uniref:M15 family metallopeptidase n=1 Tax=Cellulomonas uda TaxID=1714 RepID=UPI00141BAB94|nr:M15 family metallopeptidase [Cellulomonas uda]NII68048.1 LAS superfamily LD-carboxypeptidase LdcB [Cellulomonas uda]
MNDEPQRRRTSGSGRHAAVPARPRPFRVTPRRLAQGFVVVALTGSLGAFVAQSTAAASSDRTAMREARTAVAGAAFEAMQTAHEASLAAEDVTLDDESLAALEAATAELEDLLDDAGVADLGIAELRGADTASRSGSRTSTERTSIERTTTERTTSARSGGRGSGAARGATDEPPGAAADAPAAGDAAADAPAAGDAAADAPAAGDAAADAPAADAQAASSEPLLSASQDLLATAGAPQQTPAPADPADAGAAGGAASSATPTPDATGTAAENPTETSTESPTQGATDNPAEPSADDVVEIPPVQGPEDATTRKIRAALARVVALSGEVLDTAEEERARIAAEEEAARLQAERKKAAAAAAAAAKKAQEEAAAKAAAEAAAEAAAAERAAWKKSLLGYANGRVPSSALCALSFDAGQLLRCDAAEDLEALDAAYLDDFGTHLAVSDSYRSYGAQVTCRATKGWLCAAPGTSNHGTGIAVDLGGGIQSFGTAQHAWMQQHADEFGWVHPAWARAGGSKPEAWHWEYVR